MTKDTVTLVAIKAIDVLTENDPQHGDWGRTWLCEVLCEAPSLLFMVALSPCLSHAGRAVQRDGLWGGDRSGGFDDLKIIWEEV